MKFARRGFTTAIALTIALALGAGATQPVQAQTFTLLHTFTGAPDGAYPVAGFVQDTAGNLYGTTQLGGITSGVCATVSGFNGINGCGTVFKVDTTGAESVLYSFTGGADGKFPSGGLVRDAAGNLYGTTAAAVFKLDMAGKFTVLHSPGALAGLVMDAASNLYGSSPEGIFKLDPSGIFTVLDSSAGSGAALALDATGNLYGTTEFGGLTGSECLNNSCGTVFELDTTGTYTTLHSFAPVGGDGFNPAAGLVLDAAGNLYGTTLSGGALNCVGGQRNPVGCGTVFKLSPAGAETIFNFQGGDYPNVGLVLDTAGNLFGSAEFTGPPAGTSALLFEMNASGKETALFSFTGGDLDRSYPTGSLVLDAAGNLFGTTQFGGSFPGAGTVFKLDPSGPANFPLTVAPAGTGSGTVTSNLPGINCPSSCAAFYLPGTSVTLTAAAAAGSSFSGWTGVCSGAGICNVTTGATETVVFATFNLDFSLSASALTPGTVRPGRSSTSTVNVGAQSGFSGSVALTCAVTPTPALAPKCSINPSSAAPGTSATLTVSTTGPSAGVVSSSAGSGLFYALCLPLIGLFATRVRLDTDDKRRTGKFTAAALVGMLCAGLVFQIACGGGSSSAVGGGSKGTPAGTYTITVTGKDASGALVHSTPTLLMVQ